MSDKLARNLSLTDLGADVIVQSGFGELRGYLTDFRADVSTIIAGGSIEAVYIESVDIDLTAHHGDHQTLTVHTDTTIRFPKGDAPDAA